MCFTCQNMLSIVLPRKPSLVSEERSLGPNIVMNSSKSTCPSPASRKEGLDYSIIKYKFLLLDCCSQLKTHNIT